MAVFCLLVVISFMVYCFWKRTHPKQFPPGPWSLPLLGNMLQFSENPLKDLDKLAKKYGPVFSLYMGGTPIVFIHGFPSVKEVLVTKGTEFAGRADNAIIDVISKKKGIISAPYGQVWKEQRRFALMVLRNFGLGKRSMEERILKEATHLIQAFTENMSIPFDPHDFLGNAITNIMTTIMFGKRFEYDDSTLTVMLERTHQNTKIVGGVWAQVYNSIPPARWLPLPHQTLFSNVKKIFAFFSREVEEHKATFVPGEHRDFVDAYLEEIQKPENKKMNFDEECLLIVLSDLFIAGSETTSGTMQWGLLYLMAFPEIQEKCQKEIDAFLGNHPCLKYEDRGNLPYTNAVIHEIQRVSNIVPLGIAHAPIKDMQLCGYTIPKGTTMLANLHSVHHDESQWKYPSEFNPSNFLNEKGDFMKPEAFLPFSAGPRVCLGENLARMELFLFFTSILRNFQLLWPDESRAPDFTPIFGITMPPSRFKMSLKRRQQNEPF